jgi:general secretion pathway protein H
MLATGDARPAATTPSDGNYGFTLIEALVVMAVSALIAGIIFPGLERALAFWQFRSAAVIVETGLERGRALALREDATVRFAVSPAQTSFALPGEAPTRLPQGARLLQSGTQPILFFADGTSSGGVLGLSDDRRRLALGVIPDTGLVERRR